MVPGLSPPCALLPSLLAHRTDSLLCLPQSEHLSLAYLKVLNAASVLSDIFDII